jgi:hypothetical protein
MSRVRIRLVNLEQANHLLTRYSDNRHCITHIETTRQAAEALEALRPLAGKFAATLVYHRHCRSRISRHPNTGGIGGIRLHGNAGVAPRAGQKLKQARACCALILLSTRVGVRLEFVGINPMKALYNVDSPKSLARDHQRLSEDPRLFNLSSHASDVVYSDAR